MTRGRKPKPTHLKVIEGNPGKRPLNENEPEPDKKGTTCPGWLDEDARTEWRRVYPQLRACRIMTSLDRAILADYCRAVSTMERAELNIQKYGDVIKTPSGYVQQAPHIGIYNKAADRMNRCCAELGMTPSSRSRISVSQDDGDLLGKLMAVGED